MTWYQLSIPKTANYNWETPAWTNPGTKDFIIITQAIDMEEMISIKTHKLM